MTKLRLKSPLMANLSSQAFFNAYPWKLNPLQPWERKKPTPVHSSPFSSALWGQWFCPAQNPPGTHHHFFIIFKAFSVGPELCSTTGAPWLSELFIFCGKGRLSPNEESRELRLKIST